MLGPPAGGGEDHHLHQHHSNHDCLLSGIPIPSFGPFSAQTSHMHGPAMARTAFLGCTQLSPPCTPATTIILSAVTGSSHHLPICPLLRYLSIPCHDPTGYAQPLHAFRRHNRLCVSLASLIWYICSLLSARSPTRVSLPMHTSCLYTHSSHAGL